MENGLDAIQALKALLIDRKNKALEHEKQTVGVTRAVMTAQIQWIDAVLIFLNSKREGADMEKLELRLEESVPIEELKRKQKMSSELTKVLVEFAEQVPLGVAKRIAGVTGKKATVIASKIYALHEDGILPYNILPLTQKNERKEVEVWISRLTDEEYSTRKTKVPIPAKK